MSQNKKSLLRINTRLIIVVYLGTIISLLFQNCTRSGFQVKPPAQVLSLSSTGDCKDCSKLSCSNGSINYPSCNQCPSISELVGGVCKEKCTPQQTRNSQGHCAAGICINSGINYPTCGCDPSSQDLVSGVCYTKCGVGKFRDSLNPNLCQNCQVNSSVCNCSPGQEVYNNQCVTKCLANEARNSFGQCTALTCPNGALIYPACNQCPSSSELFAGQCVMPCNSSQIRSSSGFCVAGTCMNQANNYPACTSCEVTSEIINGQCVAKCSSNQTRNSAGICAAKTSSVLVGIHYLTWHCGASPRRHFNIQEAISGATAWGPIPEFHWWSKPPGGYYCLSENDQLLQEHARLLSEAGIDFIFLDVTNWPNMDQGDAEEMVLKPLRALLRVWSSLANAPKVVAWVPAISNGTMPDALTNIFSQYPSMAQNYLGKPLLMIADNINLPVDSAHEARLAARYTTRRAWAFQPAGSEAWSFMQACQPGFRESQGTISCQQAVAMHNGAPEQLSITAAYQETYISNFNTSVPKFGGKTLQQQFARAADFPNLPILTISGWNEWIAQRFCLDTNGNAVRPDGVVVTPPNCAQETLTGNKIFVDLLDEEHSRDLEPNSVTGDKNYQLLKRLVLDYKKLRP